MITLNDNRLTVNHKSTWSVCIPLMLKDMTNLLYQTTAIINSHLVYYKKWNLKQKSEYSRFNGAMDRIGIIRIK